MGLIFDNWQKADRAGCPPPVPLGVKPGGWATAQLVVGTGETAKKGEPEGGKLHPGEAFTPPVRAEALANSLRINRMKRGPLQRTMADQRPLKPIRPAFGRLGEVQLQRTMADQRPLKPRSPRVVHASCVRCSGLWPIRGH